jgi:uncharacterized protein
MRITTGSGVISVQPDNHRKAVRSKPTVSGYLPKDFIETAEGLIFAVVAADKEQQRILSFLRYQRSDTGFRKFSTPEANELLGKSYPDYLYYSKIRDAKLHGVAEDRVVRHHRPRRRLQEIYASDSCDGMESKLKHLIQQFEQHGLDSGEIGVTGSLLIGAHNDRSDIDLVFYRREAFFNARKIVKMLLDDNKLHPLDDALWLDAYARRGCSLTFEEYLWHEARKYNKAAIRQTKFDISLLAQDQGLDLFRYSKQGKHRLLCRVTDDRHSYDYPARFTLDHPEISEVVSYTATYTGQARKGETVEIHGQLEISAVGHRRIIIGTDREASGEYIKVLNPDRACNGP